MKALNGLNSGSLMGPAYATLTIDPRNAYRSSSESSFLQAALQNGTLPTVYKNRFAQRILGEEYQIAHSEGATSFPLPRGRSLSY